MNPSILLEQNLNKFLNENNEKTFRKEQIYKDVFSYEIDSFEEMQTLPKDLRKKMEENFVFQSISIHYISESDNTQSVKFLFKTHDDHLIESVLMFHLTGRITLCISSQVGCALGCEFCATGKLGLSRNLEWFEILDQFLIVSRWLKKEKDQKIRNIVFMGMGEPLTNKDNVFKTLEYLTDQKKINLGSRHITVSTVGIIPAIKELAEKFPQVKLAISLHAPTSKLRDKFMPINKKFELGDLMKTLDEFTEKTGKRIFYEYVMLQNFNDRIEDAEDLGKLLKGRKAHVNLIPWNYVEGTPFKESNHMRQKKFQEILGKYDIPSTIRANLGRDISGACGQLARKIVK